MVTHTNVDKKRIIELREKGRTYQSIADEVGCTRQYVGQICGVGNPHQFHYIKPSECVYPNLRNWMNANKISRKELIRRSHCFASTSSSPQLSSIMCGKREPPKWVIDKLIDATGMPYEVLFSKVEFSVVKSVPAKQYNELLCRYNELLDAADVFCDVYLQHRRDYHYEMEDEDDGK